MEPYKRDFFIARIRAGYIPIKFNNQRLEIYYPDVDTALYAQELYLEAYEEAEDKQLLTNDELMEWLVRQGLWSKEDEKNYQEVVPKHIEYWKIELFNSVLKSNTRKSIRKYLKAAKEEYSRLSNIRNFYNYTTIDGYANFIRSMHIISECTMYNKKRVDWNKFDLHKIMGLYHKEMLGPEDIRELARTSPWTALWSVLKKNGHIFGSGPLTVEQQSLLSWSTMYDKIYESPDCPSDEVIDDDDMLDGWLLLQKNKREAEKNKKEIEDHVNPKMKNADEIYVMAETSADAQKIDMLNPVGIQNIKKQRMKHIQNKGRVKEQEFKDVQQKRSMQMQQAYVQSVKGR